MPRPRLLAPVAMADFPIFLFQNFGLRGTEVTRLFQVVGLGLNISSTQRRWPSSHLKVFSSGTFPDTHPPAITHSFNSRPLLQRSLPRVHLVQSPTLFSRAIPLPGKARLVSYHQTRPVETPRSVLETRLLQPWLTSHIVKTLLQSRGARCRPILTMSSDLTLITTSASMSAQVALEHVL